MQLILLEFGFLFLSCSMVLVPSCHTRGLILHRHDMSAPAFHYCAAELSFSDEVFRTWTLPLDCSEIFSSSAKDNVLFIGLTLN